jgi:hypothetical protein
MSTPTDLPPDELRALRERAYGRDADIHDDPAALARLHELEAQAAAARLQAQAAAPAGSRQPAAPARSVPRQMSGNTAPAVESPVPAVEPREGTAPPLPRSEGAADAAARRDPHVGAAPVGAATAADSPPDAGSSVADEPSDSPGVSRGTGDDAHPDDDRGADEPRRPWWRRRIALLWAGSVVAGVLLGVGLTLAVQSIDSGRIATLQEDVDAEWPEPFFGQRPPEAHMFEDFHGLTVVVMPQSFGDAGSQSCLYVLTSADGFGAGSCAAGAFPATASLEVVRQSPRALRERFPLGTSLQFVLDGSEVEVYAAEPGIVEPTP